MRWQRSHKARFKPFWIKRVKWEDSRLKAFEDKLKPVKGVVEALKEGGSLTMPKTVWTKM